MTTNHQAARVAIVAALSMIAAGAAFGLLRDAKADDDGDHDPRVRRGFEIAPVPLNLAGKNRELVGLGSYLVNVFDCNGCHSAGPPTEFARGGNPYFDQPKVVNQATYLGGGRDFGPLIPGTPHIVSRNLTPDKTGRPEGGNTFEQFRQIIRTGVDLDSLHPPCPAANCLPPPFDGNLLQVMPWPNYQDMTDHDLRAIYEYLSAVPCIEGPATPADLAPASQYAFKVLHNDCH